MHEPGFIDGVFAGWTLCGLFVSLVLLACKSLRPRRRNRAKNPSGQIRPATTDKETP